MSIIEVKTEAKFNIKFKKKLYIKIMYINPEESNFVTGICSLLIREIHFINEVYLRMFI